MGHHNEERASLILPAAAISPLRKALIAAQNAEREKEFDIASRVFAYLQEVDPKTGRKERMNALKAILRKGDTYKNRQEAHDFLFKAMDALNGTPQDSYGWNYRPNPNLWSYDQRSAAADFLIPHTFGKNPLKLVTPLKKNVQKLPATTLAFNDTNCCLVINPEKRTVEWDVDRAKNAVEDAHASALGKAFLKELETVKWTRGTGGVFRQSDEYSEDAAMDHGHNPVRISHHVGHLGEQIFTDEHGYNPRTRKLVSQRRFR